MVNLPHLSNSREGINVKNVCVRNFFIALISKGTFLLAAHFSSCYAYRYLFDQCGGADLFLTGAEFLGLF